ncbi:MAG TPA: hypothetical protein ENF55_04230 [Thermoprotei archaeon]|nr:hypothetical protein [Thermoprotei archaeon]
MMEVALKYKWNAEKRLVALEKKLTDVVREVREEGLESKLKLALRDSDVFIEKPSKETGRLYDMLV